MKIKLSTAKLFYSSFIAVTIVSCDPFRILVIKAADKPNVSISIFANENILPYNTGRGKIAIEIPTKGQATKFDTSFFYGLGLWRKSSEIDSFTNNIDSIIIKNSTSTEVLKNPNEIKQYLLKHRSGMYGSAVLTLEAK